MAVMDLLAIAVMLLLHYSIIGSWRLGLGFGLYLIFKAAAFRGNIHSMADGVIGVYIIILLLGVKSIVTFLAAVYLLQKAVASFF